MKVYITQPYGSSRNYKNVMELLDRKGIQYVDSSRFSSFLEAEKEMYSSDAYITYSDHPDKASALSGSVDAELEEAVSLNLPVIVIREFEYQTNVGCAFYGAHVLSMDKTALFDMSAGAKLKDLPEFIIEHVDKCRKASGEISLAEQFRPKSPYEGDEPHIFVSYSHKDMLAVFDIIKQLQNAGYRVWYDEGIDPASEWDENIAEHICKCSYFIAFISENYINSQNCRDEISYARDLEKERLLVYLEQTRLPAGMAMRLMRLQAIHKYKYKTTAEFCDKLFSAKGIDVAKQ